MLRGAVPILLAGNSYLLRACPNVMGSARLWADCCRRRPAGWRVRLGERHQ
ncbi:hypothetical protein LNP25_23480 [Klebsiella variicola subsp. variicola]|nr:hypothetical protein [Klebsiella variicola subsp. variicola]